MGQTVYVDLFFLINFSMDFLCFFLTSQLLGDRLRLMRALMASVIGGVYANVALFMTVSGPAALFIDILACAFMCLIAFGYSGKGFITYTPVYIAVSMVLGGFMTALFELFNRAELAPSTSEGDGISAWALLLLAVLSGLITLMGGKFFRRRTSKKYEILQVCLFGKKRRLSAFCDSGNLLRDPLSGKPCIPVATKSVKDILPKDIYEAVTCKSTDALLRADTSLAKRIRLIPAKTAVGDGMLVALRADSVSVGEKDGGREVDALLALCDTESFGEGCDALLPSEILM